jgi:hypothetical protein
MSNEELNRKMEFIVDQQVQFVADMNVMREVQEQDGKFLKEQYRKLSDAVITVVGLVGSLTKAQSRADDRINELTQAQAHTDDRINVLVQAQTRTDESFNLLAQAQTRTDERISLLAEAQTRTEERLNVFINVVERHISGNGGSEKRA